MSVQSSSKSGSDGAVSAPPTAGESKDNKDNTHDVYSPAYRARPEDFQMGGILGEGSYAKVYEASHRVTKQLYAIKVVDKDFVKRHNKVQTVVNERNVMNTLRGHPGIISLYFTFQDTYSLYYVLELAKGGELYDQLQIATTFDVDVSRFYAYELAEIIRYMHSKNVIHRDIKPSNILLSETGHVKVTDFGTAKILTGTEPPVPAEPSPSPTSSATAVSAEEDETFDADAAYSEREQTRARAPSFVGTAEYVPPELLLSQQLTWGSDWWSFGIVLYELLTGKVPFKGASEYLTFQAILSEPLEFPPNFDPQARDLLSRLLDRDRKTRLGLQLHDADQILSHPFFQPLLTRVATETSEDEASRRRASEAGMSRCAVEGKERAHMEGVEGVDGVTCLSPLSPTSTIPTSTSTTSTSTTTSTSDLPSAPTPRISVNTTACRATGVFRLKAPKYKTLRPEILPATSHRASVAQTHLRQQLQAMGGGNSGSGSGSGSGTANGSGSGVPTMPTTSSSASSSSATSSSASGSALACVHRGAGWNPFIRPSSRDLVVDELCHNDTWHTYLHPGEHVLCAGSVIKSGKWSKTLFAKKRLLILTDTPRLLYADESKSEVRGEIPLGKETTMEALDERRFAIHTPQRVFMMQPEASPHMSCVLVGSDGETPVVPEDAFVRSVSSAWAQQWCYCLHAGNQRHVSTDSGIK